MAKRLVWNFELESDKLFSLPAGDAGESSDVHWEVRFFWPEEAIITLNGFSNHLFDLSRYKIKHRLDTYILFPDNNYNLKLRKGQLLYKPLMQKTPHAFAYGKKIRLPALADLRNLEKKTSHQERILFQELSKNAQKNNKKITVDKQVLIFLISTQPKTKLELARIKINGMIYFSLCVESRALLWVEQLGQAIVKNKASDEYASFLKSITGCITTS